MKRILMALCLVTLAACQSDQAPSSSNAKAERDAKRVMRLIANDPLLGTVPQICPLDIYNKKPATGSSATDCTKDPRACLIECNLGNADACFDVAQVIEDGDLTGDSDATFSLYIAGCALGDGNACVNAGATVKNGTWTGPPPAAAAAAKCQYQTFRRMCDDKHPWGCYMVAREYLRSDGFVAQSTARYEAASKRACILDPKSGACSPQFR